jgi:uncharacterized protein
MSDTLALRDGLELHAPGAVYVPSERTLVVADVHAGYTRTLRSRGYGVPRGDDAVLLERLAGLLARVPATRVVVAGDLVHGAPAAQGGDDSALARFLAALDGVDLTVVLGNHDASMEPWLTARGVRVARDAAIGPHRVHHGDDPERVRALREEALALGGRVLVGHLHPAVRIEGETAGVRALVPAFVTARGFVCLPALSPHAHGIDVRDERMRRDLRGFVGETDLGAAGVIAERSVVSLGVIVRGG